MLPARLAGGLDTRRAPATVPVPPGFVLVDVVLPSHRAFHRQGAGRPRPRQDQGGQGRRVGRQGKNHRAGPSEIPHRQKTTMTRSIVKADDAEPGEAGLYRRNNDAARKRGNPQHRQNGDGGPADLVGVQARQRCEIVSVHHPVFDRYIGKRIIIVKVHPDTRQVWAHDDRPVTYKTNRAGRRVVDSDPSCIQSIYGFDQLRAYHFDQENERMTNDANIRLECLKPAERWAQTDRRGSPRGAAPGRVQRQQGREGAGAGREGRPHDPPRWIGEDTPIPYAAWAILCDQAGLGVIWKED